MFVDELRHAVEASPRCELARVMQPLLLFPRAAPRLSQGVLRSFRPSSSAGPYRLPHDIRCGHRLLGRASCLMPIRRVRAKR